MLPMCTERACPRDMTNELGNRCANPSCKATDEPRTKKFKRDPHNTPANYEQYQQCIQNGMGHSIDRIGTENEWKDAPKLGRDAAVKIARAYAKSVGISVLDDDKATPADVKSYILQAQMALGTIAPTSAVVAPVTPPFQSASSSEVTPVPAEVLQTTSAVKKASTASTKRNELCVHYRTGTCRNTSQTCPYLHLTPDEAITKYGAIKVSKHFMILLDSPEERTAAMNKFISIQGKKICSHYKRGNCIYNSITCPYPHVVQINPICKPWQQGVCKFGEKCHNMHDNVEEL